MKRSSTLWLATPSRRLRWARLVASASTSHRGFPWFGQVGQVAWRARDRRGALPDPPATVLYTRGQPNSEVAGFLRMALSPLGQKWVAKSGFVPSNVPLDVAAEAPCEASSAPDDRMTMAVVSQRISLVRGWLRPWLCVATLTAQLAAGGARAWASDGGSERTAYLLARALGYDDSLRDHATIEVGIAVLFKKG